MTTALILDSLQRRMSAMHSLWYQAVSDMDTDQVNHVERDGVLPIAFSLFHQAQMEDVSLVMLSGLPTVWEAAWERRIGLGVPDHGKHRSVDEMMAQRIDDFAAFCDYQRHVFDKTERWLAELEPEALSEILVTRPFPPQIATTYSARVAGPAGISRLDGTECWIYQHGLRHMGEIEHARALVGLGGMTS
ncbi:DinB family protein [Mycolicibacterium komossense]|uniref:DinB-like domain-containing protein n=1 Tax=Mycolicibacterium komossense TaxID=1779 RepID=A0ABT3C7U5_9MYCO|nr:DinB family protein [Mycolicibacterium komossense]MCV7225510.1 hypothetical protein [Mycolicibacterium komossense]